MDGSKWLLAIDPGSVHCGMAWFWLDGEPTDRRCELAEEMDPISCVDTVGHMLAGGQLAALVVEEFRLYPWKSRQQAFSQMETVEIIGQLKLWHRTLGTIEGGGIRDVQLEMQPASIKEPTTKILKGLGVPSKARELRAGGHARDAELHGYRFIYHYPDVVG